MVTECEETGTLGAAIGAGVGTGFFADNEAAIAAMTRVLKVFRPAAAMREHYEHRYRDVSSAGRNHARVLGKPSIDWHRQTRSEPCPAQLREPRRPVLRRDKWNGRLPPLMSEYGRAERWTLAGRRHQSAKGEDSVSSQANRRVRDED